MLRETKRLSINGFLGRLWQSIANLVSILVEMKRIPVVPLELSVVDTDNQKRSELKQYFRSGAALDNHIAIQRRIICFFCVSYNWNLLVDDDALINCRRQCIFFSTCKCNILLGNEALVFCGRNRIFKIELCRCCEGCGNRGYGYRCSTWRCCYSDCLGSLAIRQQ